MTYSLIGGQQYGVGPGGVPGSWGRHCGDVRQAEYAGGVAAKDGREVFR